MFQTRIDIPRDKDRHFHLGRNADPLINMAIGCLADLVGYFEPPIHLPPARKET